MHAFVMIIGSIYHLALILRQLGIILKIRTPQPISCRHRDSGVSIYLSKFEGIQNKKGKQPLCILLPY